MRFVRDYGGGAAGSAGTTLVSASMIALALVVGFATGAAVWAIMGMVDLLTDLVWHDVRDACAVPWFPTAVCVAGGIAIALWTKRTGVRLQSLEQVLAQVRSTGEYRAEGMGKTLATFALPLVSGGSVGPEAGLSGIIAGFCTWIGKRLRHAGLKAVSVSDASISAVLTAVFGTPFMGIAAMAEEGIPREDEYTFRRGAKVLLYAVSALGALAGAALVAAIPGLDGGLPRFGAVGAQGMEFLALVPLALAGWALALLYHASDRLFAAVADKAGDRAVFLPVICGLALGVAGLFLPDVLFSGEKQGAAIMGTWMSTGPGVLLLTGVLKVVATTLCLNFGWRGGNFFPIIFAGISFGYGIALLSGVDPVLCVLSVTTALVAGMTRRPLLTMALLFLCFPAEDIAIGGFAALIGAFMPLPAKRRARGADGGRAAAAR